MIRSLAILTALLLAALPLATQQAGTLKVNANPGKAGVFVDGKYLGPTANFGMSRTYPWPPGNMRSSSLIHAMKRWLLKFRSLPGKRPSLPRP